eukprot:1340552-Amphidinium_carterae.1
MAKHIEVIPCMHAVLSRQQCNKCNHCSSPPGFPEKIIRKEMGAGCHSIRAAARPTTAGHERTSQQKSTISNKTSMSLYPAAWVRGCIGHTTSVLIVPNSISESSMPTLARHQSPIDTTHPILTLPIALTKVSSTCSNGCMDILLLISIEQLIQQRLANLSPEQGQVL